MSLTARKAGYETLTPLKKILEQGYLSGISEKQKTGYDLFLNAKELIGQKLNQVADSLTDNYRLRVKISRNIFTTNTHILRKVWVVSCLDSLEQNSTLMDFLQAPKTQYGIQLEVIDESGRTLISTVVNPAGANHLPLASCF